MTQKKYDQLVADIEEMHKEGYLDAEQKAEKLKIAARNFKDAPKKEPKKPAPVAVAPKETPKTTDSNDTGKSTSAGASTGIEQCKNIIADFNAQKRAKEAQEVRQKMIQQADSPKAIEEAKTLSDSQILATTKPKIRIDVFSREQLEKLATKNINVRLTNLPQKDKKEIPKDKILSLAVDLYRILDKKIDELLK